MFDLKKFSFLSLLIVCLFFFSRAWAGSLLSSINTGNLANVNEYTVMQDSGDDDSSGDYEDGDEGDQGDSGDTDEPNDTQDQDDSGSSDTE